MFDYFFLEWEIFRTNLVAKMKTQILGSMEFSRKSCHVWNNVKNFCRDGADHSWHYNRKHAHCVLDTWGYRHTHSEHLVLTAFPLQQWFALTRLDITFIPIFPLLLHYLYAPFLCSKSNNSFKFFTFFECLSSTNF
jgi:hypothetical protein